jgi:hypothetical protein
MPVVEIDILVDPEDIVSVYSLYDKIQVWRSVTGTGGPFTEITAAVDSPAVLSGTIAGPWNLSGQTLTLNLNAAAPVNVTFTGTNPLVLPDVINQINTVVASLASESGVDTNKLKLTSIITGTGSSIQVSGSAAVTLGLSTTEVNGQYARLIIAPTTLEYTFRDFDGLAIYWYKTRFYNSITNAVSEFSEASLGNQETVISSNFLSVAAAYLSDASGAPIVNRRVTFVPVLTNNFYGLAGASYHVLSGVDRIVASTNALGYVETFLVRGTRVKVFIEGYPVAREFIVPNGDVFDFMAIPSIEPDMFTPQAAPPRPIRSS